MSATLFVHHACADYDAWRAGYDALAEFQSEHGVLAQSVHRSPDDPNVVTVLHRFASLEEARAFVELDELKEDMERIGVVRPVRIEILEDV